jgi:ADP-heptose:LPS heptosyltransferase
MRGRRGIPALPPDAIRRMLLIRTDRIGDIVLTSPALQALLRRFPQARIDLLVQARYSSLLDCYPGWTNVIAIADVLDSKEIADTGNMLASVAYDVVFVLHPAAYAYRLAAKSKAKWIIGWKAKGYGHVCTHAYRDDRSTANRHQVENNLLLLAPLGIAGVRPEFAVTTTPAGEREAEALLASLGAAREKKLCVVHPGSYSPRVRWLPQRFAELIDRIHGRSALPVIIGAPSDQAAVAAVQNAASCRPASVLTLSLQGLVSVLKRAAVFIGNSTGPLHIAASLGIPTVGIFGSRYGLDRSELWAPYGKNGSVVSAPRETCAECLPWTCPELRCMQEVTVDMVWEKVGAVIDRSKRAPDAGQSDPGGGP